MKLINNKPRGDNMYEMLLNDLLDKLKENGIDISKLKISEEISDEEVSE